MGGKLGNTVSPSYLKKNLWEHITSFLHPTHVASHAAKWEGRGGIQRVFCAEFHAGEATKADHNQGSSATKSKRMRRSGRDLYRGGCCIKDTVTHVKGKPVTAASHFHSAAQFKQTSQSQVICSFLVCALGFTCVRLCSFQVLLPCLRENKRESP